MSETAPSLTVAATVKARVAPGLAGSRACSFICLIALLLTVLSACDPAAVDHTPEGNILDSDTESLEGGVGHWEMWYATKLARSTERPHRGQASLRIAITAPDGWGVQFDNWPGFAATAGPHHLDLWVRTAAGSALDLAATVRWRNEAGNDLQTDALRARPSGAWQAFGRDLTAPAGTTRAALEVTGSEGGAGDAIDLDEIFLL